MATEKAYFATGCFWCTEAIFQKLKGVISVTPGYSGGEVADPTYEEMCTGTTGHAECIEIEFNPEAISYSQLSKANKRLKAFTPTIPQSSQRLPNSKSSTRQRIITRTTLRKIQTKGIAR